jgi:hypothetical protein
MKHISVGFDTFLHLEGGWEKIRGRSSPPFGNIAIFKGNLARRQVPFFCFFGPGGLFSALGGTYRGAPLPIEYDTP